MGQNTSTYNRSYIIIALLLCMVIVGTTAQAQFKAGIQGSITDTAGAVIPEVKITLTNKETGQKRDSKTSNDGFYRIFGLPPGTYKMLLEKEGMKKVELDYIIVDAESIKGLDSTMEAGAITDVVNVSAGTLPSLQTENANVESTITTREVQMLPQVGRDPFELVRTAPGVFGMGARGNGGGALNLPNSSGPGGSNQSIFQVENQVPVTTGGQRVTTNSYQIDGVSINSQAWGGAAVITPSQEAVKEMKVAASSYSAENGRNSGIQVEVVTKNGTNNFHGSAFFKYNEPALNAYNKWGGPNPGDSTRRIGIRNRQFGGSVGGPILKNKLFFFATYETQRYFNNNFDTKWAETPELAATLNRLRPTSIAAKIVNHPNMRPNVLNVVPTTCEVLGLPSTACKEVAGGLDLGKPVGTIGSKAPAITEVDFDGIPDIQRVFISQPSQSKAHSINTRFDFQATSKDLIAYSLYYVPKNDSFFDGGRQAQKFHSNKLNHASAFIWNRTISSTMTNEARFNISGWSFDELASNPNMPWGIPNVGFKLQDNSTDSQLWFGPGGLGVFYQRSYNFRDVVTKVVNSHGLKFGVDYVKEQNNDTVAWSARPSYKFGDLWSFANDAPNEEWGFFDPRTGKPTDTKKKIRTSIYGLFVQDEWKVRPNLTLNLGLRYEYFTPIKEADGAITNVLLGQGDRTLLDAKIKIGGYMFEPDKNNFAPQLGFAWSPNRLFGFNFKNKTVLRGGFGMGYNRIAQSRTLDGRLNPPLFGSINISDPTKIIYSLGSDINGFYSFPENPNTKLTIDPNTNLPTAGARVDLSGTYQDLPTPYTYRYSLEAQYELPGSLTGVLGYQGSSSRKFPRVMLYSLFFPTTAQVNNVSILHTDVNSNFNALLARITRRFSNGLQFNAQYRWSKSMDHCSNDDNCVQTYPVDQNEEWAPSDFDIAHSFTLSGTWDIPIRRDMKGISGNILGGWQISPILTMNSGFPWTATYSFGDCGDAKRKILNCPRPAGYIAGRQQNTSNDAFISPGGSLGPDAHKLFIVPTQSTQGNLIRPGIGRNTFRGPGYFSLDMSLTKRVNIPKFFVFGEGTGFDLRANFFNIFNKLNLEPLGHNYEQTRVNNPNFGRAPGALGGRMVELQARFSF